MQLHSYQTVGVILIIAVRKQLAKIVILQQQQISFTGKQTVALRVKCSALLDVWCDARAWQQKFLADTHVSTLAF